jgi:hypothetical protein
MEVNVNPFLLQIAYGKDALVPLETKLVLAVDTNGIDPKILKFKTFNRDSYIRDYILENEEDPVPFESKATVAASKRTLVTCSLPSIEYHQYKSPQSIENEMKEAFLFEENRVRLETERFNLLTDTEKIAESDSRALAKKLLEDETERVNQLPDQLTNDQKAHNYILDPANRDKVIVKHLSVDDDNYNNLQKAVTSLQYALGLIDKQRNQDLIRYKELKECTRLVENYDLINNEAEAELFKLHQTISKRTEEIKPKESDYDFCRRWSSRSEFVRYPSQKSIPEGVDYDEDREYLRSYNREIYRKKTNSSVSTVLSDSFDEKLKFEIPKGSNIVRFDDSNINIEIEVTDQQFVNAMHKIAIQLKKTPIQKQWIEMRDIFLKIHDIHPDLRTSDQNSLLEDIVEIHKLKGHKIPATNPEWLKASNALLKAEHRKNKLEEKKQNVKQNRINYSNNDRNFAGK